MLAPDAFRDQPVLTGPRVRLQQLDRTVLEPYWANVRDPETARLTGTHSSFTHEQIVRWLESRADRHDRADWAAIRIGDDAFLGEVVVNDVDPDNGSAGLRIALAGRHLGRGYGPEIISLVLDHVFDTIGLHRVELEVFGFNTRAIRAYEKCGFRPEGRRRDALLWCGERHDAVLMSVLRTDPRPRAQS